MKYEKPLIFDISSQRNEGIGDMQACEDGTGNAVGCISGSLASGQGCDGGLDPSYG